MKCKHIDILNDNILKYFDIYSSFMNTDLDLLEYIY
jgi:hypothetical protein